MKYYIPKKISYWFIAVLAFLMVVLFIILGIDNQKHSVERNIDFDEYYIDDNNITVNIVSFEPVYVLNQYEVNRYSDVKVSGSDRYYYICKCNTEGGKTIWLYISKSGYLDRVKWHAKYSPEKVLENEENGKLTFSSPICFTKCTALPAKRIHDDLYNIIGDTPIIKAEETIVTIKPSWE